MFSRSFESRVGLVVCLALAAPAVAGSRSSAEAGSSPALVHRVPSAGESPDLIRVDVSADVYEQVFGANEVVLDAFPLPAGATAKLELDAADVLRADTRFVAVDESGEREVPPPPFRAFRGAVVGEPGSAVSLNLFGGKIGGFVRTGGEEFVIVPDSFAPGGAGGITVRKSTADSDAPDTPMCAADLPAPAQPQADPGGHPQAMGAPPIDENTVLVAEVAIDANFQWYDNFGNLAAAQSYILNLMAQVSTIYQDEVKIAIEVPYLRVFETPADPYTDTTNTTTLLNDLVSEWNAHQTGVTRTVAHLFGKRPSGGAGIAYLDALCTSTSHPGNSWDYGVSTLSALGGSWEKSLVAHELGHNFSSPHTHCYVPEIDQCANEQGCYQGPVTQTVGTIMSYCNSFTAVFHPRVEDEAIRPAAEAAYPSCISAEATGPPPGPPQNVTVF